MAGLLLISRNTDDSELASSPTGAAGAGRSGVEGGDGEGDDDVDAADSARGAVACSAASDRPGRSGESVDGAVTSPIGSVALSTSPSESVFCCAEAVEVGCFADVWDSSSFLGLVFCCAETVEVGFFADVWGSSSFVELADCWVGPVLGDCPEFDWETPVPDAELSDDSEPESEDSAAATPWPVVMATPNPNATAPTRSHCARDSVPWRRRLAIEVASVSPPALVTV